MLSCHSFFLALSCCSLALYYQHHLCLEGNYEKERSATVLFKADGEVGKRGFIAGSRLLENIDTEPVNRWQLGCLLCRNRPDSTIPEPLLRQQGPIFNEDKECFFSDRVYKNRSSLRYIEAQFIAYPFLDFLESLVSIDVMLSDQLFDLSPFIFGFGRLSWPSYDL